MPERTFDHERLDAYIVFRLATLPSRIKLHDRSMVSTGKFETI